MKVSLIAAVADNGVIGKDNDLVWSLPDDMSFFKASTRGRHVIMGRRNYESIPHKYRPLPGRPNIILSRNSDYDASPAALVTSLDEALEIARKLGGNLIDNVKSGSLTEYLKTTSRPYQKNTAMNLTKLKKVLDFQLTPIKTAIKMIEI